MPCKAVLASECKYATHGFPFLLNIQNKKSIPIRVKYCNLFQFVLKILSFSQKIHSFTMKLILLGKLA